MRVNKSEPSAIVVPFGKHKGATVAELLTKDPAYAEWVVSQGWVAERFAELHAAILSRGAASDDSPEHNAIQVRFLDETFRLACLMAAKPGAVVHWKARAVKFATENDRWTISDYRKQKGWTLDHPEVRKAENAIQETEQKPVFIISVVKFEQRGIDVEISWDALFNKSDKLEYTEYRGRPKCMQVGVEIKPTMGDDFPSVMRQMERLNARILVVGEYTGRAVSEPQLRQMFSANDRILLFIRDIESEIANARAELAQ